MFEKRGFICRIISCMCIVTSPIYVSRPLVGRSVDWLVGRLVGSSVGRLFVIIYQKSGKLHFHAPIRKLVFVLFIAIPIVNVSLGW